MLFEIALTVNPLAFEGFGEVYEPVLRLSLAGFRHPSLSGLGRRCKDAHPYRQYHAVDPSRKFRRCHRQSRKKLPQSSDPMFGTHKRRILPMALCESALYPGIVTLV
ncbi:hypothetical protein VNO77_46800 [Canavalia gladiata]|uniref:Uncharacterized protein n=1 Tax=Canavalia gladiata TaxID=3824 RepID=A0AAN9JGC6_CANGL